LYTEDNAAAIVELGVNPATEITANAGIALPDSQKATFGAGDDLQIYHDGFNTHIKESGAGSLLIDAANTYFRNAAGTKDYAWMVDGGAVSLFHNNANKLATTSTGIDVTGTATMDGLVVDGAGDGVKATIGKTGGTNLNIYADTNTVYLAGSPALSTAYIIDQTNNNMQFKVNAAERMRIDSSGNVGIGQSTIIGSAAGRAALTLGGSLSSIITFGNAGTRWGGIYASAADYSIFSDSLMRFEAGGSERMRIDASGRVGIGRTPTQTLDVNGTVRISDNVFGGYFGAGSSLLVAGAASDFCLRSDAVLSFASGGPYERMRIDASGNMLVGKGATNTLATVGHDFGVSGYAMHTRNSSTVLYLNRNTTDGAIQEFFKDGTTVGSIGYNSGNGFYMHTPFGNDSGLVFGSERIVPCTSTGAFDDAVVDLGYSSGRFKDLYLSSKTKYQASGGNQHSIGADANDLIIRSETAGSETARFTYGGNLLVGTTTTNIATEGTVLYGGNDKGVMTLSTISKPALYVNRSNAGSVVQFRTGGSTIVGSIDITASATTYSTSSDQRLKDNIADADDAGSKIDAIQVRKYDWKADGSHQDYGMIAQELQAVAPEAVSGDADSEEMMGVDYSKLVPMLIKEIQSLRNRVAQLETGE